MKKIYFFVVPHILFIAFSRCSGCGNCLDAMYTFNATAQLSPDYDSIRVGDTILLLSTIPFELQEQNTGTTINYTNAKTISSDMRISRLEKDSSTSIDAVPEFTYFYVIGNIYNDRNIPSPDGVQQLIYETTGEGYQLKVGFIPNRTGVYIFGLGNPASNGRNSSHSCEKAVFNLSLANTDQHTYFLQLWRPDLTLDDFGKQHAYYFKVY